MDLTQEPRAHSGLTIVELVVVIVAAGILAVASLGIVGRSLQTFIYLPRQMRVAEAASEIMEAIIEGSWTSICVEPSQNPLRGLRYAKQLTQARKSRVRFVNSDDAWYQFNWRGVGDPRMRRYKAEACGALPGPRGEDLPYYTQESGFGGEIQVRGRNVGDGQGEVVFRYFEVDIDGTETLLVPDGSPWTTFNGATKTLADVGRIEVNLTVETGTGVFDLAEGSIELVSSVAMRVLEN